MRARFLRRQRAFVYLPHVGTPSFTVVETLPDEKVTPPAMRRANRDQYDLNHGKELRVANPATAAEAIEEDAVALTDDLAATVVRKTMRRIAAGSVQPSIKEGLAAQSLLDRRAEKAADRRFMLNLAQAMAGGGGPTPARLLPAPDETLIEGSFEEIEDMSLAPAHLRSEP
jgi:hypothetical protein